MEGEMKKEKWKQRLRVKIMFHDLPIITYNYHYNIMQYNVATPTNLMSKRTNHQKKLRVRIY